MIIFWRLHFSNWSTVWCRILCLMPLIWLFLHPQQILCQSYRSEPIRINQERNEQVLISPKTIVLPDGSKLPFVGSESFVVKGRFHPNVYADSTEKTGLLFAEGQYDYRGSILIRPQVHLTIQDSTWHDSPVVTLRRATVRFSGLWKADNNYTKPILNLRNGSRFEFLGGSEMQLVFPAYGNFTRQLWAKSDGTGTVALMPGFIADRSERGQKSRGCGSIRFYDCNLETHDSAGLPVYYRPESKDPSKAYLNSHLVWERAGGKSKWLVKGSDQHFIGGLWVYDSVFTIQTDKDLHISGRLAYWSDYINYGGLIWAHPNNTIRKTGSQNLIISGDWNTMKGSQLIIAEGGLEVRSDPMASKHEPINIALNKAKHEHGQYLSLKQMEGTQLLISADSFHLKKIQLNAGSTLVLKEKRYPTIYADTFTVNGTIAVEVASMYSEVKKKKPLLVAQTPAKPQGQWLLKTPKRQIALEWIELKPGTYGLRPV